MKLLPAICLSLLALPLSATADDAMGKATYAVCLACHGPDGKGMPAGDKVMAPPLSGSKIANGDPAVFAAVVLKGIKKEGDEYLQMMTPLPLPDAQLAAVLSYVRANFGNTAEPVTAEQVAGYREKWKDLAGPLSREKIAELSKGE